LLGANPDAKILAGGYSLIPAMKLRLASPQMLVDLGKINELKQIVVDADGAHIGAMATYNDIRDNAEIASLFPAIPEAIEHIGDQQVRAHGTLAGSLAHADPAADLTPVFLSLNGQVKVTGPQGQRTIAADELFVDLWTTSLEPDEIITEVFLPTPQPGTIMAYKKHGHPASGYALAGVAVVAVVRDGVCAEARISVTGSTSKATRATAAEEAVAGEALTDETIAAVAQRAPEGLEINGDTYASEEYRAHLVSVLTRKVFQTALVR